ncbi:hypothetical protein BH11MYX3_BH11MYX3_44310 [soil metagenome]
MEKKLTVHGNSLALTIDRPLLRMLKIGRTTTLRISTDGRVLIIEPLPMDPIASADKCVTRSTAPAGRLTVKEEIDAKVMVSQLIDTWGMEASHFGAMYPGGAKSIKDILCYRGWLNAADLAAEGDEVQTTLRRFWECYRQLRAGAKWTDAVKTALERVPLDRPVM